jgi:hypothetical protein
MLNCLSLSLSHSSLSPPPLCRLRKELKQCLDRCVLNYQQCRLHAERNDSFLELQASLAEDVPGRVGFPGRRGGCAVRCGAVVCCGV